MKEVGGSVVVLGIGGATLVGRAVLGYGPACLLE